MSACSGHLVDNIHVHKEGRGAYGVCGSRAILQARRWSKVTCTNCLRNQPLRSKQQLAAMRRREEAAR